MVRSSPSAAVLTNNARNAQLTAQVERITFHRAENGWSVVRARVEGEQALVTLAGTMHGVRAGQLSVEAVRAVKIEPLAGRLADLSGGVRAHWMLSEMVA